MNPIKIFFDTNVLVYAHDVSAPNHPDSARLLTMVVEKRIRGVIAEQNIIELYRILTNSTAMRGKSLTPSQAKDLIQGVYMSGAFEVIYPTSTTLDQVLELANRGNVVSARIFDVRLAALILETEIDYFATYNLNHFQGIEGLQPLTPKQIITDITGVI